MENLVNILGQGCFPIVMCGVLCWYIYSQQKTTSTILNELKVEMASIKDAIENLRGDE